MRHAHARLERVSRIWNARQGQHINGLRTRLIKRGRARVSGCAASQDIVDQKHVLVGHIAHTCDVEGFRDVASPFLTIQATLAGRRFHARECIRHHGLSRQLTDGARKQRRLVIGPHQKPPAMKRHRHDHIGARDLIAPRAHHPFREMRRHIRPVAVFELEDQRPTDLVIDERGPGPMIAGSFRNTGAAYQVLGHRLIQRQPANPTLRRCDERETPEAAAAQVSWGVDDGAARQALRRQYGIQQEAPRRETRIGPSPQRAHRLPRFLFRA